MSDTSRLFDYRGLKAELAAAGAADLLADLGASEESEQAARVSDALRLSSHILARDEEQLAGQLLGRMTEADGPDVATLLADARMHADRPALLPLRPTLFPPGASLVRTFIGHERQVSAVAVTPDGQRALSGSGDMTLRLWDLASGVQRRLFEVHTSWFTAVAATPDGQHAISGLYDGTLILWDLDSGAELCRFEGHQRWVTAVAVAPDGRRALSASDDATVRLWDLESGAELRRFGGHDFHVFSVAMTPDGRRALSGSGGAATWESLQWR
jgi:WD40 repeat protein